jgi:perosamine synthetase
VTTGEGGVITTNDAGLARQARILRNHGVDPNSATPDFVAAGYNLRLTEFQAAFGTTQLAKADRIIAARRAGARRYDNALPGVGLQAPKALPGSKHVYQSYVALLPAEEAARRATIIADLKQRGIECAIGTYHMPLTTFFRSLGGHQPGDFPITDDVARRALTLPLFESITETQIDQVVSGLAARHAAAPAAC